MMAATVLYDGSDDNDITLYIYACHTSKLQKYFFSCLLLTIFNIGLFLFVSSLNSFVRFFILFCADMAWYIKHYLCEPTDVYRNVYFIFPDWLVLLFGLSHHHWQSSLTTFQLIWQINNNAIVCDNMLSSHPPASSQLNAFK